MQSGFINNEERDSYRQCTAVPPGLLAQEGLVQGLAQEGGGGRVQQRGGDGLTGALPTLSSLEVMTPDSIQTITMFLPSPAIPTITHEAEQSGGILEFRINFEIQLWVLVHKDYIQIELWAVLEHPQGLRITGCFFPLGLPKPRLGESMLT